MFAKMNRQRDDLRPVRIPPVVVVVETGRRCTQACHDRRSGWSAFRRWTMGVGKQYAALGQAIDVGSVYRPLVTTKAVDPILHVVHRDEQYIWFGGLGRKSG